MDQNFRIVERRESKTITLIAPEETFSVPPIDLVVETKSCCSSCRASQFEVEVTGRSVCMFLQNHGYAAAWDHEIKGQPFARTICGENVVLFRLPDRSLGALEDCCPHRLMPLSKGFLRRNNLVCGYHGLEFNGGGQCVHMPNQQGIHREMNVRTARAESDEHSVTLTRWMHDPRRAGEGLWGRPRDTRGAAGKHVAPARSAAHQPQH